MADLKEHAMYYLAAAVSDFFIPSQKMVSKYFNLFNNYIINLFRIKSLNIIIIGFYNNPGLFRFIEAQKQLKNVCCSLGSDPNTNSLCNQNLEKQ